MQLALTPVSITELLKQFTKETQMKIPYAATVGVAAAVLAFGVPNVLAQSPKAGGTLTFAVSAEPPNYDCHAQSSFAFIHPVRPHYSTLLKFDTPNYPEGSR